LDRRHRWPRHVPRRHPPSAAKPDTTLADTAKRLGALAIVNGGLYQPHNKSK